jgi:hypothetical protein
VSMLSRWLGASLFLTDIVQLRSEMSIKQVPLSLLPLPLLPPQHDMCRCLCVCIYIYVYILCVVLLFLFYPFFRPSFLSFLRPRRRCCWRQETPGSRIVKSSRFFPSFLGSFLNTLPLVPSLIPFLWFLP